MLDNIGTHPRTDDLRIKKLRPLIPPAILLEEMPVTDDLATSISRHREEIQAILRGDDPRLLVVVGPCSIHDVAAARDYAARLAPLAHELAGSLKIAMRVYFEKPRTTVGWKGLINDPELDASFNINRGLHAARGLLVDIARLDLAVGCEFLDTITPQFIADLVSWGAIGARTTESQVHRELASGLSCAVGFKNGTDGRVGIAIDAIRAASKSHHFLSVTKQGMVAIVETTGNPDCHLILRGSDHGRNDDPESVAKAVAALHKAGVNERLMIDCSHGNSSKDHRRQREVVQSILQQRAGESSPIVGAMIESHLIEGRQDCRDPKALVYGQSITDACIGWEETDELLRKLAAAGA
ncbi:MAG: 3-deoxy-7-phosphoheptulonate synthase [Pirellulales bacterium]|jgi:3-deoxy-7-phosphoheptulonate synthase|nr:3-deoxy-7-phosphoheptulonate synthase [Pirellulales bacterium]MBL7192691.1 3-deoxy-7-phosphoheptulonate synthase [Pirellulales bacterium]MDA0816036.1 3-deoxy-7-phosphoheptulonate synthase [Planctomycetota bacterium]